MQEAQGAFETFNLDLMYALPGQTLAALDADLATALAFSPPHLSLYHLTIEPNTLFATRPPADLPDDDLGAFASVVAWPRCLWRWRGSSSPRRSWP